MVGLPHTAYVPAHEPTKRVRIGTPRPDMVGLKASDVVVGRHNKGKAYMISWRTWISKVHVRTNITFSLNINRHHVAYIVQHNISIHKAHKHSIKNVRVHAGARRHALSYIIQLALESGRTSDKSCEKQTKVGGPHAGTQWQGAPRAGSAQQRTGSVALRTPADKDLPFKFSGRDTWRARTVGRIQVRSWVARSLHGARVSFQFLGIWVGSWTRVSARRCTRSSTECSTRILLVARRVSPFPTVACPSPIAWIHKIFQIRVKSHINLFVLDFSVFQSVTRTNSIPSGEFNNNHCILIWLDVEREVP